MTEVRYGLQCVLVQAPEALYEVLEVFFEIGLHNKSRAASRRYHFPHSTFVRRQSHARPWLANAAPFMFGHCSTTQTGLNVVVFKAIVLIDS